MDNTGASPQVNRPVILVVDQVREMENFIRSGILACPSQLEFCGARRLQVIHHIECNQPALIIAPLQLEDVNAADLVQEVISKTGAALPGIFISDPRYQEIQDRLAQMGSFEFLPKQFNMQDLLIRVERTATQLPPRRKYRFDFMIPVDRKNSTAA